MKKKCHVYKTGGNTPAYKGGGQPRKELFMTQDSKKDPVFLEKTNNFMQWLHQTNDVAKVDQMIEADILALKGGYISDYQIGGPVPGSGYETGDYGQKEDINFGFYQQDIEQNQPNFLNNLSQFTTGTQYAQAGGASFPGLMPLLPEEDTETMDAITGRMAEEEYSRQQNPENFYQNAPTEEFIPGGSDDPFNKDRNQSNDKGKFGSVGMDPRNTNITQGAIAGMKTITGVADYFSRRKDEEALKKRFSDVFQTHGTAGADRGDYLTNVPGIGTNFKPDQTTLMGYNTKIAQAGYEIEEEVELSEAQINNLIEQGYNLEYLD